MKTTVNKAHCLLASICLVLVWGCSPSGTQDGDNRKDERRADGSRDICKVDLSREMKEFAASFECGDGYPLQLGAALVERIANLPDAACRTNCLMQFRKAILAVEFSDYDFMKHYDYTKLRNGLGVMSRLQELYQSAGYRCGCDWEEELSFWIDFLKWLQKEMERPLGKDTSATAKRPGLRKSKEDYEKALKDTYKLHLRWMEEAFHRIPDDPSSTERKRAMQHRIEEFLGRPIRSEKQILRDRGVKM